jgi:hypothetical protein
MADDKVVAASIKAGRDPLGDDLDHEKGLELIFGRKITAFKADVTGELTPLFDYKAEMEKAKAGQDAMVKKLGLDLSDHPAVMPDDTPKTNNTPKGPRK